MKLFFNASFIINNATFVCRMYLIYIFKEVICSNNFFKLLNKNLEAHSMYYECSFLAYNPLSFNQ